MINTTLLSLYLLIILFALLYFNKDRLKSILLRLKKDENEIYVKICPRCGSASIKTDFSNPVVWAYGTAPKYKCGKCGYMGMLFPELPQNKLKPYLDKLNRQEFKASFRESVDTSTGFFVGKFEIFFSLLTFFIIAAGIIYGQDPNNLLVAGMIPLLWLFFIIYRRYKARKTWNKKTKSF